jgi:hypothetical protein
LGKVWRKIEMRGDQTLADLHVAIQDAYDFDNDHLYSFFMSGKAWDRKSEYSLPEGVTPFDEILLDEEMDMDEELPEDEPEDMDPDEFLREEVRQMTQNEEEAEQLFTLMKALLTTDVGSLPEELLNEFAKIAGQPVDSIRFQIRFLQSMWEDVVQETKRDVRRVKIEELCLKVGKQFMYLFDYGDEWRFKVKVTAINPNAADADYPKIVQSVGEAPPQYPDIEEDWDEDDDEDADDQ